MGSAERRGPFVLRLAYYYWLRFVIPVAIVLVGIWWLAE